MDTKKIKAMLLAIEKKSMAQAALEYSYTPSAFSHMADSLEKELGVKIFLRNTSGVALTDEGKALYGKMKALIDAENELFLSAKQLSINTEYELRIGAYSSISNNILPEILRQFKEKHPEIRVSISVRNKVSDWEEDKNADVIFTDISVLENVEAIFTVKDPYVAIVPKSIFVGRKSVLREELYKFPFISTNSKVLQRYFDQSQFPEVVSIDSVDDLSAVSMVREGIGITVLPNLVVKNERKGVRTLKLQPALYRQLGFSYNKGVEESTAAKKFIEFVKTMPTFK